MTAVAGKVAIVTGGASGIGLGSAGALSRAGAKLVIADIDGEGVAAAAAIPLAGVPFCAVAQGPTPLDSAIAARKAARIAWDAFDARYYTPAEVAFDRAREAVPHHRTEATFLNAPGKRVSLCTDDTACVIMARKVLADRDAGILDKYLSDPDYLATIEELVAAADGREAEIQRLRHEVGFARAGRIDDWLSTRDWNSLKAVIAAPVASVEELTRKIEFIEAEEAWGDGGSDAIVRDVRSLGLGGVAA